MSAKSRISADKTPEKPNLWATLAVCALLVIMTLVIYWRTIPYEFLDYDDYIYIVQNPHILNESGMTPRFLTWAFADNYDANWMPLVWVSFMVDHQSSARSAGYSGEEDPAPYHRTNVLLHASNAVLLFLALFALTGSRWRSALVAALFAVHPLHVESVAWIAERKDVLSTFFFLLTLLTYAYYCRKPGIGRYLLTALAFLLGLMSKPMVVTLPVILVLLDFWPLRRVAGSTSDGKARPLSRLLIEKVPLFALALAVGIGTIVTQKHALAIGSLDVYPLGTRLANSAVSYISYIAKMFYPTNLACLYPHPHNTIPTWEVAGAAALFLLLTSAAVLSLKRVPYVTIGWLWYVVTLLPVIGLLQVGTQAMADRYTYLPLIGVFIVIAWGIPDFLIARGCGALTRKRLALIASAAVLPTLMAVSCVQAAYWRDGIVLFTHALSVTRNNSDASICLGLALNEHGDTPKAIEFYRKALDIDPRSTDALYCLGTELPGQGRLDEAITHLQAAVKLNPTLVKARVNLGVLLGRKGRLDEAIVQFKETLRLEPGNEVALGNIQNAEAAKKARKQGP